MFRVARIESTSFVCRYYMLLIEACQGRSLSNCNSDTMEVRIGVGADLGLKVFHGGSTDRRVLTRGTLR